MPTIRTHPPLEVVTDNGSPALRRVLIAVPAALGILTATLHGERESFAQVHRRLSIHTVVAPVAADQLAASGAQVDGFCPLGMPKQTVNKDYGPPMVVIHDGYLLQQAMADKIPLWVCEHLTAEQVTGDVRRADAFQPDPAVPQAYQAEDADYEKTGFDRGHQAAAANQGASRRLNAETFFYSNMSPQRPQLNRSIWKSLETWTRSEVNRGRDVYVITGPIFYDPQEDNATTADGLVEYLTIGPGGVSVPTHFFKIVYRKSGAGWEALAFVMENKNYSTHIKIEDFRKPIEWIEQRTGFEFFPKLSASDKNALANGVATMW